MAKCFFEDRLIWDKESNWAHGTIDLDENAYQNGMMIDNPHGDTRVQVLMLKVLQQS